MQVPSVNVVPKQPYVAVISYCEGSSDRIEEGHLPEMKLFSGDGDIWSCIVFESIEFTEYGRMRRLESRRNDYFHADIEECRDRLMVA